MRTKFQVQSIYVFGAMCCMALALTYFAPTASSAGPTCSVPGTYSTIQAAVNDSGCTTINVGSGTITENVNITRTVTINGAGATSTIVDGNAAGRVFFVNGAFTVAFSNMTIRNGNATGFANGGGVENNGGNVTLISVTVLSNTAPTGDGSGIANETGSTMTVVNSSIISNTQPGGLFGGAGIFNNGTMTVMTTTIANNSVGDAGGGVSNAGTLTITNSAIISNTSTSPAHFGGGIGNSGGTLTILNSTISGNQSNNNGGGIGVTSGTVTLNNVTVTNNTADNDADGVGDGGGIRVTAGTVTVRNSIIAKNTNKFSATKTPDCSGTFTTGGYNFVGNNTGCTGFVNGTSGDKVGTSGAPIDPKLDTLKNNGGGTLTHALLSGSPALDAGNPATPGSNASACLTTDQRGITRPQGPACDMGAFELQYSKLYLPLIMR